MLRGVSTPATTQPTYAFATWIYLRTLGWCATMALLAMHSQALGLVGSKGLTPIAATMARLHAERGGADWLNLPTVFWLSTSDTMVQGVFLTGIAASVLLFLGVLPRWSALLAFLMVLSVRSTEGQGLRWFNWPFDDLLAESLFVGVWLAGTERWSLPWRPRPPAPWARWLLLWLLFRLILGTGFTKVRDGGPWLELSAVHDFVLSQPFPLPLAWAMFQGPAWITQGLALYTMAWELLAPWAFWWRGLPARVACFTGVPFMIGIWAVGSFRGFNHLTIAMLLVLVDDAWWRRWLPSRWRERVPLPTLAPASRWRRAGGVAVASLVAAASLEPVGLQAGGTYDGLPLPSLRATLRPFHLAANYWVFSTVAKGRLQLVVQGSADGETWRDYEPHALPARVDAAPVRVAPGNDHLGFLMWLCAFGEPAIAAEWQPPLLDALLRGEPSVRALFRVDPFPDAPPRHVRILRFVYAFATPDERAAGTWWRRVPYDVHRAASR